MPNERILLVGGTFDPPHRAHIALPALVADELSCRRIIYIPAARSPFKPNSAFAPDSMRIEMLRIATRKLPSAEISTIEIDRGGASYFVETLETMHEELGAFDAQAALFFIIGADQALAFHRWRKWRRILELATPAVLLRAPWSAVSFGEALVDVYGRVEAAQWQSRIAGTPFMDISATEIRRRLAEGLDTSGLLDPAVAEFIAEHGLYAV